MVEIREVSWGGWGRNLRLANADVELIVTLEVGPRIMRYAPLGGPNALKEVAGELGRSGEETWKLRGGHRLWVSPEDPVRTYVPDNGPVELARLGDREEAGVRVSARPDARFGLERTMEISLAAQGSEVTIVHRIRNLGAGPCELAPWALTVMAPGGVEVLPLPAGRTHPGEGAQSAADFAPHLTMALWPYFRFDDPRVSLGRRYLRLRQDPRAAGPTKLGLAHRGGWAAYWLNGTLFSKRFGFEEGSVYPDGGCNFETYTDAEILELETLGPLVRLAPGRETSHLESWALHGGVPSPEGERAEEIIDAAILPLVGGRR